MPPSPRILSGLRGRSTIHDEAKHVSSAVKLHELPLLIWIAGSSQSSIPCLQPVLGADLASRRFNVT